MKEHKNLMKISELSAAADLPASTIMYYIVEGLLPAPIKTGKTRAYYSKAHLKAILLIKKKQFKEHKSLKVIKEEIKRKMYFSEDPREDISTYDRHQEIISSAIELFLQKGYANTSIADIAHQARMSKETFYLHFKNKEELFMECADRIFHDMYNNVWQEIKDEEDRLRRIEKLGKGFYTSYPKWIEMMNLVRGLAVGENQAFKDKFKALLRQMIHPMVREIEYLQKQGRFRRDIDPQLAGYYLMGIGEYGAYLANQGTAPAEPDKIREMANDFILYGLLK
ncbi:MAG: TetR family transcriptional regulator [Deltaproteobacteria bacterium]|nr:TetR family transcriptional regulator [Deltaproteobacteria bacterium]